MTTNATKSLAQQSVAVLLAAGQGTRMERDDLPKVCFEIDGEAAICRTISMFKRQGVEKFMLVVGSMAEQVMATVNRRHPGVTYVYQSPQLGTGHAARIAAEALQELGHAGPVLVNMGDKYIEPVAAELVVDGFLRQQADVALLATPRTKATMLSSGRLLLDDTGQAVGIVERMDVARQSIADELRDRVAKKKRTTAATIMTVVQKYIERRGKMAVAVPELLKLAGKSGVVSQSQLAEVLALPKYSICVGGKSYTARQIEDGCRQFNPSFYMFTAEAFYRGTSMLDNTSNAQGEYYLTDVVEHLGNMKDSSGKNRYRVRTILADSADVIQGFNSPDQLLAIQDYARRKKLHETPAQRRAFRPKLAKQEYCSVTDWIAKIESASTGLSRWLRKTYGEAEALHDDKRKELLKVLKCYGRRFGFEEKVVIVRAPGRINLMGRHVDHRGGYGNFLALHRETIAVVGLRDDDNVVAVNTQPKRFKSQRFSMAELIGRFAWSDWLNFVNSDWVRKLLHSSVGDWGNYIKAAVLRLQHHYQDLQIRGLNIAVCGTVPIAAGLSSSSTIVVATLQAAIALNNLELDAQQFVDLCGEGEWFVGTQHGPGDYAAIALGQRDKIANVGYLPFRVEKIIDAPADYQVVIANSHIKSGTSEAAKDLFNARIASYNLGMELLLYRCPEIANRAEYVRDLNPEKLACATSDIYRLLLKVPEFMTRKELTQSLGRGHGDMIEENFASHHDIGRYPIRGVLLFGAAECQRSRIGIDYLEAGRIEQFGDLMAVSHDGDRVARAGGDGVYQVEQADCSDGALNGLMRGLASEDPERVLHAQLYMQPGSYACSTEDIDRMVDIARSVPGVAGAQIAGAGLGGCIMILARKDRVTALRRALSSQYYRPRSLMPDIINCIPAAGAALTRF